MHVLLNQDICDRVEDELDVVSIRSTGEVRVQRTVGACKQQHYQNKHFSRKKLQ